MIGLRTLAVCCALAGCARAVDDPPEVLVTLDSITVTSVDSGQPAMAVHGVVSATTRHDAVRLFDHDATNPVSMKADVAWPAAGTSVGDGIITIARHVVEAPEIELRYDAEGSSEVVSLPYEP